MCLKKIKDEEFSELMEHVNYDWLIMLSKAVDLLVKMGLFNEFVDSLIEPIKSNFILLFKNRPNEFGGKID